MPRASDDPLAGLPRNFQRPCLLLLIGEKPSHGYDLLDRLRDLGFKQADPGLLYRSLRAMEQEGLVKSDWEVSELGPPRRRYELSDEGKDWLHAWAGSLRETERMLDRFLHRYALFTRTNLRIK
ncbi:poly-beta-hydroxybutyrate-responsive repressor [Amycolatopsis marina]|uniref:Poly-beta-hydroxybutyrate-responsive repressor n=1 Tax=Amycolatopsis marina TaxID=490629 RepID=A0A1I1C365_9PSEU|nr:PadR family transcriptional regulator [Amycolatopsis marina]SFB57069.1 poly-beta-hydroxybutyrate-responsive repressor [Amycolatopsis marina]